MRPTEFIFMVQVNKSDVAKVRQQLGKYAHKAPEVISRALNRAAEATRTQAVRATAKRYYLKSKDIRDKTITYKASKSVLLARVISKDHKMPLERFRISPNKPRPTNPPVLRVGIKRDGGLKKFPGAFVIPNLKIYERVGKSRYPIKRIYGPAVPQLIGGEKIRAQVEIESIKVYEQRLDHEIKRVLEAGK